MSTRALIARKQGDGFTANYHHWDGYPSALGHTLWLLYHGQFNQDLAAMLQVLIDDHPAGWSTVNDADWSSPAGYGGPGPECYCHGSRREEPSLVTDRSNNFMGAEFVYVLDIQAKTMTILGRKMQWFGLDDKSMFLTLGVVDLDGDAPDWEEFSLLRARWQDQDYN